MIGYALPLQRALMLTEEEALALLEMCALTLAPDRQVHRSVVDRVGGLCRQFGDELDRHYAEGSKRYEVAA